jgi:hypothetical protein
VKSEVHTIDFPSKQLAPQDSKLKGVDSGKKTKKQTDDLAAATVLFTAAEHKASEEGVIPSVVTTGSSTETISTALAIAGASEAIDTSAGKDYEKKDPPLT